LELSETRGAVTIVERRVPWRIELGPDWTSLEIARFGYAASSGLWTLYWQDRNERWRRYDSIAPNASILALLAEVGRNPCGVFWG
jgi:hypothetical protein